MTYHFRAHDLMHQEEERLFREVAAQKGLSVRKLGALLRLNALLRSQNNR
ncbi:MAG: hypothetical protein LBJ11_10900 [Oscillospiraceae bacterium]|nr:hypothetical protein [Oscillospiraceae bacterium]